MKLSTKKPSSVAAEKVEAKLSTKKSSVVAEKVEASYDLLMSIIVRLPPKSVFRFRCVSNRWNNIIADPYFLRSYSAITRKHGRLHGEHLLTSVQLTGLNICRINRILRIKNMEEEKYFGDFITCSNGLVLCSDHYSSSIYHVFNPLTKKLVSLPPTILIRIGYIAFVCEENTNELIPNYMIIRADMERMGSEVCVIETYSSKTGTWSAKSTLCTSPGFRLSWDPTPLVCNGVVYWSGWDSIALYDLNGVENENYRMQLIRLPIPEFLTWSLTRSEREDVLWLGYTEHIHKTMQFWILPKKINDGRSYRRSTTIPSNEWILMHTITMDSFLKEPALKLPELNLCDICLEGFIFPSNPIVVVIRRGERLFLYNLETKSIYESFQYDYDGQVPLTKWWYPYMGFLYLSSYAL